MSALIKKTLNFAEVALKMKGETGAFEGYASKFDGVDSYGDTIKKGAFLDTLKAATPKMFFNHEWTLPVGKWLALEEDSVGLFVAGELTPGLSVASDVRAAMKHGTLDGLSIGGFLKKDDYQETATGRVIHRWSKLAEISPVVFPADEGARVDLSSVKAYAEEIQTMETIKEFELFLRDAGGFSKGAAQALTARAKALFTLRDAGDNEAQAKSTAEILERIQRFKL